MMKPVDFSRKPVVVLPQPIDAIGLSKVEPIAPVDNLLMGGCAIGLRAQVVDYIYTYIIYIYLLTYCTHSTPYMYKTRIYMRARARNVKRSTGPPPDSG